MPRQVRESGRRDIRSLSAQRANAPQVATHPPTPVLVQRATSTGHTTSVESRLTGSLPTAAQPSAAVGELWPGSPTAIPVTAVATSSAPAQPAASQPAPSTSTNQRVVLQRTEGGDTHGTSHTGGSGNRSAGAVSGVELDELARRLVEPIDRLLRADLRQGRERAGHPYDRRR